MFIIFRGPFLILFSTLLVSLFSTRISRQHRLWYGIGGLWLSLVRQRRLWLSSSRFLGKYGASGAAAGMAIAQFTPLVPLLWIFIAKLAWDNGMSWEGLRRSILPNGW
jgi:hypothetical protein